MAGLVLSDPLPSKDGPKAGNHPRAEGIVLTYPSSGTCLGPLLGRRVYLTWLDSPQVGEMSGGR
jgi:hypothetical protein